ncbi:asparagine synthase (glutamine-hydrolyzing) [bacterium]|nr:asparagine synthase (glutamine-hydrolyzing) [bacterium]
MCGIAGLLDLSNTRPIDPDLLDRMTDVLAHRGPDGRGTWIEHGIGLGHRRLAIVDPEGGAQPWRDSRGLGVLTYNGELYNQRFLRKQLEAEGVRFRSNCDTEVVMEALLHWGIDRALDKFRGMFAFGLWEMGPQRLTLARDPMGVKPLYWSMRDSMVRFGSEIKAILADPAFPREPDLTSLVNYLSHYRLSFDGRTLFRHIQEVQPGTYVQWTGRRRSETRYWSLPMIPEAEKNDPGEEAVAEGFRTKLIKSVKRRLMADVPVGAYLSGGIDSAVLTTVMKAITGRSFNTFSIGFGEEGGNEFEYSQAMAKHLGVQHKQVTLTEEAYFKEFESLIHVKDTPLSVPNEVPLRYLSRFIKKKVTVVLSGEGADELLAGYTQLVRSPHDALLAQRLQQDPGSFSDADRTRLTSALGNLYGERAFTGHRNQFLHLYQWIPQDQRGAWFNPDLPIAAAETEIRGSWDSLWDRLDGAELDPYEKVLHILQEIHLKALLLRLDATSMAEGVEGRVPYTDRNLVEWVAKLPLRYKLRWRDSKAEQQASTLTSIEAAGRLDIGKYVLRLAFAGTIPDEILMRPKTAFPVPLDTWLYGSRQEWLKERVLTPRMGELFDLKALERDLLNVRGKQEAMKLWMLANLGIWLEMYFNGPQDL